MSRRRRRIVPAGGRCLGSRGLRLKRRRVLSVAGTLALAAILAFDGRGIGFSPATAAETFAASAARAPSSGDESRPSPGRPEKPSGGKSGDGEKAKDGGESGPQSPAKSSDESAPPKVIRRDSGDSVAADAAELKATVGADGRVAFQFRNQPWVDLVGWLAEISGQPLDWQELPGDRVNMVSPGRYTVGETRDLFNRHLLSRGYTILALDGGLVVSKTSGINAAIVPRVAEAELESLPNYAFVRTLLDVGWLSAEKLAEELKPMVSSNGRLTAMTSTNRIEAMDAAVNLRQILNLLRQERDTSSRDALAPEFKLRHVGAEEAKAMLEQFLGVEKKKTGPLTPQQIQMMRQMQQRQGNSKSPAPKPTESISIVANVRQNSVIVRAPLDRIAVAREFIARIDVPSQSINSLADVESRVQAIRLVSLDPEKLIEIVREMNVLEPTTRLRADKDNRAVIVSGSAADRFIINTLIERLDGSGRQFEVLQLRRLDPAEVAESIGFLMGQKDDKKKDSGRSRYSYYGYGGGNDDDDDETDEFRVSANTRYRQVLLWANASEMKEVESLLVKLGELPPPGGNRRPFRTIPASASPETYDYLQRLQEQWKSISPTPLELPDAEVFTPGEENRQGGDEATGEPSDPGDVQTPATEPSDAGLPEAVDDVEADLVSRDSGPAVVPGPAGSLEFAPTSRYTFANARPGEVPATAAGDSAPDSGDSAPDSGDSAPDSGDGTSKEGAAASPLAIRSGADFDRAFGEKTGSERPDTGAAGSARPPDAPESVSAAPGPPIRISLDPRGNLVIASPDTGALDRLENLMLQVSPPRQPYHVFYVEHQSAYWIYLNLTDYYKDLQDDDDDDSDGFSRWYWGYDDDDEDTGPAGLGKDSQLQFVWDDDTKSIVVRGATSEQLATIADLIELWDRPKPVNDKRVRYTKLVQVRYGDAASIATTIKDAYRDLLSSNDKAFSRGGGRQNGGNDSQGREGDGGGNRGGGSERRQSDSGGSGLENASSGQSGGGADFSFKGKLSIGIDEVGNTLIVSAEGEALLKLVEEMIDELDEAARPSESVQVIRLSGTLGDEAVAQALEVLGVSGGSGNRAARSSVGREGAANRSRGEASRNGPRRRSNRGGGR